MNNVTRPLVSVVIPSYNHARYIDRTLQSVLDQTYCNWEAIIIDNHSTDNTDDVMKKFSDPRITYLKIHNCGVIAASRNAGIRAAKGEWIAFLDSDDWWEKDKLKLCSGHMNENVDFIYHTFEMVSDKPDRFRRKKMKSWQVKPPVLLDLLLKGNAIVNSSVVVRKSMLESIGGINVDREMIAAEDYNTWLRVAQMSNRFVYLPRILGYYLQHHNNVSLKDMSLPARKAVAEFIGYLSVPQKIKLEANFRYSSGQFNYLIGSYSKATGDFWYVVKYGYVMAKLKCLVFLLRLIIFRIRA